MNDIPTDDRAEAIERVKDWSVGRVNSHITHKDLRVVLDELETLQSWHDDDSITNARLRTRVAELEAQLRESREETFSLRSRINGALRA